jgi:hypothetical protein
VQADDSHGNGQPEEQQGHRRMADILMQLAVARSSIPQKEAIPFAA